MSEMQESLERAQSELKRADHLTYVSLKYTRTVDVLKSIILRLIATIDEGMDALLHNAKNQGKIPAIPSLPRLKVEALKKVYDDEMLRHYLKFYLLLRKLDKASFGREKEYRRHVTMKAAVDNNDIEITIDIINDYYHKTKEFLTLVRQLISQ